MINVVKRRILYSRDIIFNFIQSTLGPLILLLFPVLQWYSAVVNILSSTLSAAWNIDDKLGSTGISLKWVFNSSLKSLNSKSGSFSTSACLDEKYYGTLILVHLKKYIIFFFS